MAVTRTVGDNARTSTTWLDAPDAKRILAFNLPADTDAAGVEVVLWEKGKLPGGVLLDEKVRPLDC